MTFTTSIKEEISKQNFNNIETIALLSSFIRYDGKITSNQIELVMENASVARLIYKSLKMTLNITPTITNRIDKKFKEKNLYILQINNNTKNILEKLNITYHQKKTSAKEFLLESDEEKIAYIKGLFLSSGSINNPQNSGYHLEFFIKTKKEVLFIIKLFKDINIIFKFIKRTNNYMVYLKNAEMISDILKMFNVNNALFYYEDIRIYRDHKNMVNRLNNCEIANQEKIIKTGLSHLENIKYLKEFDLYDIIDDRTKEIIDYREKYPEASYSELAEIITEETGKKIGKSGINHYFIKINKIIKNHQSNK